MLEMFNGLLQKVLTMNSLEQAAKALSEGLWSSEDASLALTKTDFMNGAMPIIAKHLEAFARERNEAALDACKLAHSALDKLMGDSDLDSDDSIEMKACQALAKVIKQYGTR
jgi:hypothetical protein